MKDHKFANIFPLMDDKELKALKEDIKKNGLLDPIIIFENKILDGRNRYKVCKELKIKPKYEKYKGNDAFQFVTSTNKRRQLTDSQRAVAGVRWKKFYSKMYPHGGDRRSKEFQVDTSVHLKNEGKRVRVLAGEEVGCSGSYIQLAEEVINKMPEAEEMVMNKEIKLKTIYKELKLEKKKKEIKKLAPLKEKYDVVVMDPPWKYDKSDKTTYDSEGRRVASPYPEMSLEEIKKDLSKNLKTEKDCVFWCWVTNNFMEEAYELVKFLGFKVKTILTWNKQIMGTGYWLRGQTEHCLLCIKGKPIWDNKIYTTLISEKRTEHSKKPESFYDMVDKICYGKKLDYFAGKKRKGWDVYGDEVK